MGLGYLSRVCEQGLTQVGWLKGIFYSSVHDSRKTVMGEGLVKNHPQEINSSRRVLCLSVWPDVHGSSGMKHSGPPLSRRNDACVGSWRFMGNSN